VRPSKWITTVSPLLIQGVHGAIDCGRLKMESDRKCRYFKVSIGLGLHTSVGVDNGMVVDIDDRFQAFRHGDFSKFLGWVIRNFQDIEIVEQFTRVDVDLPVIKD
jgi:hypothetical protein